ncbi:hypothetical protein JTB14_001873 [Gonioctena quinquepunctata]|nr:hypothetical protein JTB14_001873 [Gonioctena quinquepunctata]
MISTAAAPFSGINPNVHFAGLSPAEKIMPWCDPSGLAIIQRSEKLRCKKSLPYHHILSQKKNPNPYGLGSLRNENNIEIPINLKDKDRMNYHFNNILQQQSSDAQLSLLEIYDGAQDSNSFNFSNYNQEGINNIISQAGSETDEKCQDSRYIKSETIIPDSSPAIKNVNIPGRFGKSTTENNYGDVFASKTSIVRTPPSGRRPRSETSPVTSPSEEQDRQKYQGTTEKLKIPKELKISNVKKQTSNMIETKKRTRL